MHVTNLLKLKQVQCSWPITRTHTHTQCCINVLKLQWFVVCWCVSGPGPHRPVITPSMTCTTWEEASCTCRTWWIEESLRCRPESGSRSASTRSRCRTRVTWTTRKSLWNMHDYTNTDGLSSYWSWWFDVESGMLKHVERAGMFFTRSYSIINGSLRLWFMPKVNVKLILALIGSLALRRPEKSISASVGVRESLFMGADVDVRSTAALCFNVFIDSRKKRHVL